MDEAVHLDRAVARRILRGDAGAFRALFDRFFPRLYRYALARLEGDRAAAEDVVQQAFCKAIERLDSYRGEAALYTWFWQICHNTLLDHCRAANRGARKTVSLEEQPAVRAILEAIAAPAVDHPEVQAWRSEIRRLVQATMDALPERYGEVLEWKYIDELPVKDLALRLKVAPKAAESLLARARGAFRDAILTLAETPDALQPPWQD